MTSHVTATTGIAVVDGGLLPGLRVDDLVDLALRVNPRRPHLLVSRVLGKHVPTDPRLVRGAGRLLGLRVAAALGGPPVDAALVGALGSLLRSGGDPGPFAAAVDASPVPEVGPGLVLGYAETATALGHLVAATLGWTSVHSTRREVPGFASVLDFEESHSHATSHRVLCDAALLTAEGPVVLVDDELSTGRTALATIRALHGVRARERYVVATLVDVRSAADREAVAAAAHELGTSIDVVALATGTVTGVGGLETLAAQAPRPATSSVEEGPLGARLETTPATSSVEEGPLGARLETTPATSSVEEGPLGARLETTSVGLAGLETLAAQAPRPADPVVEPVETTGHPEVRTWPWRVSETGRHGFTPADEAPLAAAAALVAADLATVVGDRVLVLGTEELMYAPLAIADALRAPGREVRFSTTTRSPVRVLDEPGYPVGSGLAFPAHDGQSEPGPRFAYNVAGDWTDVVVVVDSPAATAGIDALLAALAPYPVRLVVLPSAAGLPEGLTGPDFGSYAADEVTWLLQDLSHVALEAETALRERAIQAGEAHYAESLPVEYRPEPAYRSLYAEQLAEVAPRVATAVGAVTELAVRTRGRDDLVLVSLARAGTPIGILMRRWARHRHGLDWPHLAVSIVRDRGIDQVAMRYLAARYDPRRVLFVDGWTGKGAITREFHAAVEQVNRDLRLGARGFDPDLAVLADPGACVSLYGTRDDFLIPSACLNSTVSGLVSRTVLNADLVGPGDFHGAKFYAELAPDDVSEDYLDAVGGCFDKVDGLVDAEVADLLAADRSPTWAGWAAAVRLRDRYGLPHVNLVKPGVGETTRVLLRRVPWQVVVNPDRRADLRHVELLAAGRGVPVVEDADLPYSCVGLIRPTERDGS